MAAPSKPRRVFNPPNPWAAHHVEYFEPPDKLRLQIYEDASRTIVSRNQSPDISFEFSVNPYRGCMHGCAYCYARPGHEYLDFSAGSDFERKIVIKARAPELLAAHFEKKSWRGDLVMFSGVTDCYQPLESRYELTRRCLEVCLRYKNPVSIVTKSPLVERDIELLAELGRVSGCRVMVSIPLWDPTHARAIEPWVPAPQRRMQTLERLVAAGIDAGVMVAPLIPGLGDEDMPKILEAAACAGAKRAGIVYLRLPSTVREVFEARVREALPLRAEKILARVREARGGRMNDARFGHRMRGDGPHAAAIHALFESTCRRLGLHHRGDDPMPTGSFERPDTANDDASSAQLRLW